MQEMARGFSLFETWLVFEAKNPSIEWYTQTFRMQSLLLCHLRWEKKRATTQISLGKEMATHSSSLAWRISWTEEPGRLQSMGVQESDTTWWLNHHHHPDITESFFSRELIEFNPPRNQNLCHQYQAWVKLQLALHLLLLTILQFYHLPPPPVSNSSCLFTCCQPPYVSCYTVLLYFSRYCTKKLKMCF